METAETPFIDNWFAGAAAHEAKAWNRERGLGEDNDDRTIGKKDVFDITRSKPVSP